MSTWAVVKVQLPQSSNERDAPALVYDQTRAWMAHIPVTPELRKKMGDRPKAFFYAERQGKGSIVLGVEAPYQEW